MNVGRGGLPGLGAVLVEEATGGAVGGQGCQTNRRRGALLDAARAAILVQVGRRVAGIGGVDFDCGVFQFGGKGHGNHIDRRLGGVVGKRLDTRKFSCGVAVQGQRTQAAGVVDDPARVRLSEQGKQGAGDREEAEDIGVIRGPQRLQRCFACRAAVQRDSGVVDQNI